MVYTDFTGLTSAGSWSGGGTALSVRAVVAVAVGVGW